MTFIGANIVVITSLETEELSHFIDSGINPLRPSIEIHLSNEDIEVGSLISEEFFSSILPLAVLMIFLVCIFLVDNLTCDFFVISMEFFLFIP